MKKEQGKIIALIQGIYYIITGVWPMVSMPTFVMVTGPKVDYWLVRMVGLLAATIGGALVYSLAPKDVSKSVKFMAILSIISFASIDFYYSLAGVISKIYMIDGWVQIVFLGGWAFVWLSGSRIHGNE